MRAFVYKSSRKADTYIYLAAEDAVSRLPEALRAQLGALRLVMELELTPERRLARENPLEVMEHLASRGYHLQMPLESGADPMQDDWGTDA